MAKKDKVSGAAVAAEGVIKNASESSKAAVIGVRGVKGVPLTAKITLLVPANPKRSGSKAFNRFALYKDGQTCDEALTAGVVTPDLVYDAAHGYIAIEGYNPTLIVKQERPAKAPKEAKAKKVKHVDAAADAAQADLAAATVEESID
jgi:hypothetical protein